MATLQVRDIDNDIYDSLKILAKKDHRSISQEVAYIIEAYIKRPKQSIGSLSWAGNESAEEIIRTVKSRAKGK